MLDNMTFSFSRLTTYERCPYAFYLQYIKAVEQNQNAFAEFGLFCHDLLERYFTNKLMVFELLSEYKDKFTQNVIHDFPPNRYVDLAQSYFQGGYEYFTHFNGLPQYQVVDVEKKVNFNIDKYKFTGYLDLVAKNKNGETEIIDHKSKDLSNPQKMRWNNIETRRTTELYQYLRQLYLYCVHLIEQDKAVPTYLNFNCFRKNKWIQVPFDMDDYNESKQWALDIIERIYADENMSDTYNNDFFCNFICGVNYLCPCSQKFLGEQV